MMVSCCLKTKESVCLCFLYQQSRTALYHQDEADFLSSYQNNKNSECTFYLIGNTMFLLCLMEEDYCSFPPTCHTQNNHSLVSVVYVLPSVIISNAWWPCFRLKIGLNFA